MTVKRMDNVGIVVEDIDAAIEFFTELGLTLEGRMPIEGEWAGRVTGVRGQRVEIAMMRTPDGHSRLELSRFDAPAIASDHRTAPVNSLGYLRVMFTVEDIDDTLARLQGEDRIAFRYVDAAGETTAAANPNGSALAIAGILSERRNILGLMPHPEDMIEPLHGGSDCRPLFEGLVETVAA